MKRFILYGATTIIFIVIASYYANSILKKKEERKTDKTCELFYFYTTWCPYCKKAVVEWNKFKAEWDHKTVNGYVLQFREIDCDVNEALAAKYNVSKYPTIKLVKDDTVIDYDAKPSVDSLTRFLSASFE